MITKIFWFQFVNSYASFFYLAFIAESLGDCPVDGCMKGLTINLAIIFGTRLIVGNIMELGIPYVSYWYKYREETKRAKGDMSQAEKEYLLDPVRACVSCLVSSLYRRLFVHRRRNTKNLINGFHFSTIKCRRVSRTTQRWRSASVTRPCSCQPCLWRRPLPASPMPWRCAPTAGRSSTCTSALSRRGARTSALGKSVSVSLASVLAGSNSCFVFLAGSLMSVPPSILTCSSQAKHFPDAVRCGRADQCWTDHLYDDRVQRLQHHRALLDLHCFPVGVLLPAGEH